MFAKSGYDFNFILNLNRPFAFAFTSTDHEMTNENEFHDVDHGDEAIDRRCHNIIIS